MNDKERPKRLRKRKFVPNTMQAYWGRGEDGTPDLIFQWGPGCSKRESNIMYCGFSLKHYSPVSQTYTESFLEMLDRAGFDLTTLEFKIRKKS